MPARRSATRPRYSLAHLFEPVRLCTSGMRARTRTARIISPEHLSSLFPSRALTPRSFALCPSRFSPSYRQSAYPCLTRRALYSAYFPFYQGGVLPNLFVLSLPRSHFTISHSFAPLSSLPQSSHSHILSLSLTHSHSHTLSLSLSLSLPLSLYRFLIYSFGTATHFEAIGFRPHIAIVSGDRRFGNTPRREQLLINVILPAHF